MLFAGDTDARISLLKFENGDHSAFHKLSGHGTTEQLGKLRFTHGKVLLDLHDAQLVAAAFRLYWEHVVGAKFSFNLPAALTYPGQRSSNTSSRNSCLVAVAMRVRKRSIPVTS